MIGTNIISLALYLGKVSIQFGGEMGVEGNVEGQSDTIEETESQLDGNAVMHEPAKEISARDFTMGMTEVCAFSNGNP